MAMRARFRRSASLSTLLFIAACGSGGDGRPSDGGALDGGRDAPGLPALPEVRGAYLLTIDPVVARSQWMYFTWTITSFARHPAGNATFTSTFQPLDRQTRAVLGVSHDLGASQLSATGHVDLAMTTVTVPEQANNLSPGTLTWDAAIGGLVDLDEPDYRVCGTLATARVRNAVIDEDLSGSTWSAIRIPEGMTAADLRSGEPQCPERAP
jgi:hypothetical protein